MVAARLVTAAALCLAAAGFDASAQSMHTRELGTRTQSPPVVTRGAGTVTQLDMDVFLERVAPQHRAAFLSDPDRIAEALTSLMLPRQLANRALAELPDSVAEPLFQAQMQQSLIVLLAERYMEHAWQTQRLDDYEDAARELYLVRKDLLRKPVHADFTHLLVRVEGVRGELDAMRSILNVYELLGEEAELAELAREYSEDPSVSDNAGRLEAVRLEDLDPAVADMLRELQPGQISQPFRSEAGWHIVELHDRYRPELGSFEDERSRAIEIARERHRNRIRERILQELNQVPAEYAPGAIDELLARYRPDAADLGQLEREIREILTQHGARTNDEG